MNIFGFGCYGGVLGHYFKFHLESNTYFHWFDYTVDYDERENGIRIRIEFLKIQLFLAISSNIQDVYAYMSDSYFLRQEHSDEPDYEGLPEYIEEEEGD